MKKIATVLVLVFGVTVGLAVMSWADASSQFEAPPAPLVLTESASWDHFDRQVHSRDNPTQWDSTIDAQHGAACQGPPATHPVLNQADAVYICNNHVMTTANAGGYGEVVITPSQTVNCSAGCSVQWDMSTERMSLRDWPDIWLTPWNDNLTLPFGEGVVDLQGYPRRGVHVTAEAAENSWAVETVDNYAVTERVAQWWVEMETDVAAGTNQAAVRQTFKLTITPGHVRLERLASATAPALVFNDDDMPVLLAPDYVVQFAQHSYNPTKDGAGVPATWHWDAFTMTPSTPFTLIHMQKQCISCANPWLVTANNSLVTFNAPAPAGVQSWLRFSGICTVQIDGNPVIKQASITPYHSSSYFVPIAAGKQSVTVSFAPDGPYSAPCNAKDFHIWSKAGGVQSTPTPSPTSIPPTVTSTSVPSATSTPTVISPTATLPAPTATRTSTATLPTSTPTPVGPTRQCTLRWGNNTVESYGNLTQAECAARGQ